MCIRKRRVSKYALVHEPFTTTLPGFLLYYRVSQKHGNSVTNSISSLLWISILIPNFKSHNIIMSARVYFMKRVKDCKDVSIMSPKDKQWRRTRLLYCKLQVLLSTTVCSQNINKQNVNTADETLTNYSFLSRYHHTKSKNCLKRRYRIPMFIGTPCIEILQVYIMKR